ncbi:MAG: response regulator [Candidatus Tectomicrobia bacterium]|uniref:histidine kinase n=1 Tax=Tectimicrobiota bacterium TaxID=2528274 RepID=A0A933GM05_UNCTE|nr:response regulator [Candidatus Tectomicrobia bacterium]
MNKIIKQILLVEDNPDHIALSKEAIREGGIDCHFDVVNSGTECLELLKKNHLYDAILMDFSLPEMNGLQILKKINEYGYDIPVIMVTGQGDERVAVEAMKQGAYDYLQKTQDFLVALPLVLEKAIEKHQLKLDKIKLEHEIKRSEEKYRKIIENANDIIFITDFEGNILDINRKGEFLLGYDREQFLQMNISQFYPSDQNETYSEYIKGVKEGIPANFSLNLIPSSGENLIIDLNVTTIELAGRTLVLGIGRDITERAKMEEKIRLMDKLASLGEMSAGIAHEIRNPLSSIITAVDLLSPNQDSISSQEREALLDVVKKESKRLNTILTDFLQFAKPRKPVLTMENINEILCETFDMVRLDKKLTERITIKKILDPNMVRIPLDRDQIKQVFLNVYLNAFQAMPRSGQLLVTSKLQREKVIVNICDNGVGIPKEDLQWIFEPFHTRKKDGTGLGLPVASRIIEAHQGTLEVESRTGEGTCFIISLPTDNPGFNRDKGR